MWFNEGFWGIAGWSTARTFSFFVLKNTVALSYTRVVISFTVTTTNWINVSGAYAVFSFFTFTAFFKRAGGE